MSVNKISRLFNKQVTKEIFEHLRNLMLCAFLLAIGSATSSQPDKLITGTPIEHTAGILIIVVAIMLMILNLGDGIRMIWRLKFHLILSLLLVLTYILIAARIVMLAWDFRIGY